METQKTPNKYLTCNESVTFKPNLAKWYSYTQTIICQWKLHNYKTHLDHFCLWSKLIDLSSFEKLRVTCINPIMHKGLPVVENQWSVYFYKGSWYADEISWPVFFPVSRKLSSILIDKISSDKMKKLQTLNDVLSSYDVLWSHLWTHQNNMKKQNIKHKLSMFSLYRSIVFWQFFPMDISTGLWHCITICHNISRNTGF